MCIQKKRRQHFKDTNNTQIKITRINLKKTEHVKTTVKVYVIAELEGTKIAKKYSRLNLVSLFTIVVGNGIIRDLR